MTQSLYGPDQAQGIWVYLEQQGGQLEGVSLELLAKGRELADETSAELTGVLLGDGVKVLAKDAVAYGVDRVLVGEDPELEQYRTEPYARVVTGLVADHKPDIFLLGATPDGRDLAGRLAVRLRTGLTADCTDLALEDSTRLLLGEVTGFGGGILATIKCEQHRPQMATVRPGVFAASAPDRSRKADIQRVNVTLVPEDGRVEVLERVTEEGADLTRSKVIVAGGRGTRGDFSLLEELAELLGGEVGATRVAVDEGWIGRDRQIGQTGFATRPDLAILCGISGAMQFTVGVEKAETVIAINSDPEAEIFEHADYGVADDLFQVLKPLVEQIKQAQAK